MIAVLFEVQLKAYEVDAYFDLAASLKSRLLSMPGFISVERFQSLSETNQGEFDGAKPAKILSLSFWQDEESVKNWREQTQHNHAQQLGREQIFDDYRIRVAHVVRDYTMTGREEAPAR